MERYSLSEQYGFYFKGFLFLWSLFALGSTIFIWIKTGPFLAILSLVFYIAILIHTYHLVQNVNVLITETDITYCAFGITVRTEWKKTEEIRKVLTPMLIKQECIIVDQSNLKILSTSALGPAVLPYSINWNPQKAIIPLSQFQDHWRERDLGMLIKRYAPHLFEPKGKA